MKHALSLIFGLALLLAASIGACAEPSVLRMSDRSPVAFAGFLQDLGTADVVFLGDTHDDLQLHHKQVEIVRALYTRNPKLAIGLEMFTSEHQRDLDLWSAGKLEEREFVERYARNWSYDWSLYRDIFIFARDNRIPMIALNVPKPVIAKVVRQGSKALSAEDRQELPPGGPWLLGRRQAEYLGRIRQRVFGNRPSPIPSANFDEAQALRNEAMAYHIAAFRKEHPERKVVVVAGTWHAIKNGVPESLRGYGNFLSKAVIPDLVEFAWLKPTVEDIDYLLPREQ